MEEAVKTGNSKQYYECTMLGTSQYEETINTQPDVYWTIADELLKGYISQAEDIYGAPVNIDFSIVEKNNLDDDEFAYWKEEIDYNYFPNPYNPFLPSTDGAEKIVELVIRYKLKGTKHSATIDISPVYAVLTDDGWILMFDYANNSFHDLVDSQYKNLYID